MAGKMWYIVYRTFNLINDHCYVGVHKTKAPYEFDGYFGSSELLLVAIKKYGKKNFKRETLFVFDSEDEAYVKEAEIVNKEFVSKNTTYNAKVGGIGGWVLLEGENHPNWGNHLSEEHRKKISEGNKGKIVSLETRKKLSEATMGERNHAYGTHYICGEERRQKIRKGIQKHYASPKGKATRQKLSEVNLGENNHWFGKHFSEEHCKKISEGNKGKVRSEKFKRDVSERLSLSTEVVTQRRKDTKNISKVWGWKAKLGRKWRVNSSVVDYFLNKYAPDLNITFNILTEQRRKDVEREPKTRGWQTRLSLKWGISQSAACTFINRHIFDSEEGYTKVNET